MGMQWTPKRANGESGLDCSQAVAAGMLPAPCPCVPWWDGFPWDPAQGAWWEQTLAQILAVNWEVLTHTLEKPYPAIECWMCKSPMCQIARVGLGLYRKGMILPCSLEAGRLDTLATDWKVKTARKGFLASRVTRWRVYVSLRKEKEVWIQPGDTRHQALCFSGVGVGCSGVVSLSLAISCDQDNT